MKDTFNIIIIDDNDLDVENLIFSLRPYTDPTVDGKVKFTVDGKAKSIVYGKKLILRTKPDLVFLEAKLGDTNGLELIDLLRNEITWDMKIIFYTILTDYENMVGAIRECAFDYLLKPVDKNELSKMIKRFLDTTQKKYLQYVPTHIQIKSLNPPEETFIILSATNDLQFLQSNNIVYLKYNSDNRQWEVFLSNSSYPTPIRRQITAVQILEKFPSFIQIHQSYIVNINYLIMIKDKKCVFHPPFNKISNLRITKLYMKKILDKFLHL